MCIAITRSCATNPFLFKILDYRFFDTPFLQKFAHLNRVMTVYDYQIKKLMNALDFDCKCIANLLTSATELSVEDAADVEAIILPECEWECATVVPSKGCGRPYHS